MQFGWSRWKNERSPIFFSGPKSFYQELKKVGQMLKFGTIISTVAAVPSNLFGS
jgi:hypothetical protein